MPLTVLVAYFHYFFSGSSINFLRQLLELPTVVKRWVTPLTYTITEQMFEHLYFPTSPNFLSAVC